MELGAFLKPLRRWWRLLLASTALAAFSSCCYVLPQPAMYEARTTLIIGQALGNPNPTGNDLSLSQQLTATYADLVQRRPVREQTMAVLGLTSLPEYSARPVPDRQLLEIVVVDTIPERAKAVADELARQLVLQSPTAPQLEEQQRQAFINDQLASLQANIQQTQSEITATRVELENAFSALEISGLESEITALQTKLNTLQSNYAALLANTSEGAINAIEVIEPAILPLVANESDKTETILVISAIALFLAVGTAYLLESLDDTIRTPEDLARVNPTANLPSIPEFGWGRGNLPILAQDTWSSPVTESFRALRTGLYAATVNKLGRVLLITSATPREGKSLVAANLAAVLAEAEKKVLLIDADLRRPVQHKLLGVSGDQGLAELLVSLDGPGQTDRQGEMIERAIQPIGSTRLALMAAGSTSPEAVRLLGSDKMKALLETVSRAVDYVIVDSPSLLIEATHVIVRQRNDPSWRLKYAVRVYERTRRRKGRAVAVGAAARYLAQATLWALKNSEPYQEPVLAVADALMLSTQVDGVVLVARAGSIQRRQLAETIRRLGDVKANVVGVVLNQQKAGVKEASHEYSGA
jgi:non-specific protein-tyrosine kinase